MTAARIALGSFTQVRWYEGLGSLSRMAARVQSPVRQTFDAVGRKSYDGFPTATPRVFGKSATHSGIMASEPPYEPHPRGLSSATTESLRAAVVSHLERNPDGDAKLGHTAFLERLRQAGLNW